MFYEAFEKDAEDVGLVLGLQVSKRGAMKMVGFPATHLEERVAQLIGMGMRVARVEEMSVSGGNVNGDVIVRGMKEVMSVATWGEGEGCIACIWTSSSSSSSCDVGMCCCDVRSATMAIGNVEEGQVATALARWRVREVVMARTMQGATSLRRVAVAAAGKCVWERGGWDAQRGRKELMRAVDTEEALKLEDSPEEEMMAAAGMIAYLEETGHWEGFKRTMKVVSLMEAPSKRMALDANALQCLQIEEGPMALMRLLQPHMKTPQGLREMRLWAMAPLNDAKAIHDRQQCIEAIRGSGVWTENLRKTLRSIGQCEAERIVQQCAQGNCGVQKLVLLTDATNAAWELLTRSFNRGPESCPIACPPLESATQVQEAWGMRIKNELWSLCNWKVASADGVLDPSPGEDAEADAAREGIRQAEAKLEDLLESARKSFHSRHVEWKHLHHRPYLIEVPDSIASRAPPTFQQVGTVKGFVRFSSPILANAVAALEVQREALRSRQQSFLVRAQQCAAQLASPIRELFHVIAHLDCLQALAGFVDAHPGSLTKPEILPLPADHEPVIFEAHALLHPGSLFSGAQNLVANDVMMGTFGQPLVMLVTGPNMGGKSTLLRSVAIAAVMAQMGCWVPCEKLRMTVCDGVYTRMGARDDIWRGHSTFMMEMQETSRILHQATRHSLVVIDELGRGTSTVDGHAIAHSVLHHLQFGKRCRTLFSTHLHQLAKEFSHLNTVGPRMMSFVVENGTLVFLYRLVEGVTPASYGMNVARMAGVPEHVVARGEVMADAFQKWSGSMPCVLLEQAMKK